MADYASGGEQKLVFLHAIRPGPASRSFGLQVAELAGVPKKVVRAAKKHLAELEQAAPETTSPQLGLFEAPSPAPEPAEPEPDVLRERLSALDCDALSPREALSMLYELKALSSSDTAED